MIHRVSFVNRYGALALLFALQIRCLVCLGLAQEPTVAPPESEYYRQAVEKFGGASKVIWGEPGENSLDRWKPRSFIEVQAVVVSWEADQLVVVKPGANGTSSFPGDLVAGIEPNWKSPAYAQVHELFKQHKFREVLQQGQAALAMPDIPRWQQRIVVAEMIDSAVALEQYAVAARIFKILAQDTSPELLLSRIPLPWTDELTQATPALTQEALAGLENNSPAMQLLGAAWLLGGEHRLVAIEKLKSIAASGDSLMASYAKSQLWRLVAPEEVFSTGFAQWTALRDQLPLALQAGPSMLLAHRLDQAGQTKIALTEWLRVTSLHEDRYHLRNRALQKAIQGAKNIGDQELAARLSN